MGSSEEGLVAQIKTNRYTGGHEPHTTITIHVFVENCFITAMGDLPEIWQRYDGYLPNSIWLPGCYDSLMYLPVLLVIPLY